MFTLVWDLRVCFWSIGDHLVMGSGYAGVLLRAINGGLLTLRTCCTVGLAVPLGNYLPRCFDGLCFLYPTRCLGFLPRLLVDDTQKVEDGLSSPAAFTL